ncbi:MAG: hypothetical protein REI11_13715 [Patulibacter sp.]|nr:hypothetical protein [Patulibacter sp.]
MRGLAPAAPSGGTAPSTPAAAAPKSEPPAYWSGNTTGRDAGAPPASATPGAPAPRADTGSHTPAPPESGVPVDFFEAGDAENAFAPEAAPEPQQPEGDVLDQTPDFLEETPEHDRMWFEQRPPRDFDFG